MAAWIPACAAAGNPRVETVILHRRSLLHQRHEVHNPIRDLLETANGKLSSVASDLLGVSGRRILEAMIAGENSPELRSGKVRGSLRKKEQPVRESLKGYFDDFHRRMLGMHYRHYEFITGQIQQLEVEISQRMQPYAQPITALLSIPGVARMVAWHLIAEMGADMSVSPEADHCARWVGVSPGRCECGQAVERADPEGQPIPETGAHAGRLGRFAW